MAKPLQIAIVDPALVPLFSRRASTKPNATGYAGVYRTRTGAFRAQVPAAPPEHAVLSLGSFKTLLEAAAARYAVYAARGHLCPHGRCLDCVCQECRTDRVKSSAAPPAEGFRDFVIYRADMAPKIAQAPARVALYVFIAGLSQRVLIGATNNVHRTLGQVQAFSPEPVWLLAWAERGHRLQAVQDHFAFARAHRRWFGPEVTAIIRERLGAEQVYTKTQPSPAFTAMIDEIVHTPTILVPVPVEPKRDETLAEENARLRKSTNAIAAELKQQLEI